MAQWCARYGNLVSFLCVSVEGKAVAQYFSNFTGSCINATVIPGGIPAFPIQLGCAGFVIIDKDGNMITTRSAPSFLDAGERAFRSVEGTLDTLLSKPTSSSDTREVIISDHNGEDEKSTEIILKPLPAVGYVDMDDEHGKIDDCLRRLVAKPSTSMVVELKGIIAEHFHHEEQFLMKMDFGSSGLISAYESHAGDHRRILSTIDNVLNKASQNLCQSDISNIASIIHQHGERFDILYAKESECKTGT